MKLIVDVRTREEYVKNHIKGAINIPLYDLDFYTDFLKDKEIFLYCDSGKRSKAAAEKLRDKGINAKVLSSEELKNHEWERKSIICTEIEFKPTKYILMTFWESKEAHEKSHKHPIFVEAFKEMPQYLAKMPYEEFYEIIK